MSAMFHQETFLYYRVHFHLTVFEERFRDADPHEPIRAQGLGGLEGGENPEYERRLSQFVFYLFAQVLEVGPMMLKRQCLGSAFPLLRFQNPTEAIYLPKNVFS